MTHLPPNVAESALDKKLIAAGLKRIHEGKVCNTYALPGGNRLAVRTNRVSIFDFVLSCLIPRKGEFLTALTAFWLGDLLKDISNHLVAYGAGIDQFLPPALRGIPELHRSGMIVKEKRMLPIESIIRGYLTGSAWKLYKKGEPVCGLTLPAGLYDGAKLIEPLFTPTTKATVGHDTNLDAATIEREHPWLKSRSIDVFNRISTFAAEQGILFVDTKFEYATDAVLADEVGTTDSSRWWDADDWARAIRVGKTPDPFDKQVVRNWGLTIDTPFGVTGLNNLDPSEARHLSFVDNLIVPSEIVEETSERCQTLFKRLTGQTLDEWQKKFCATA